MTKRAVLRGQSGFSVAELAIVVLIIGLLAVVAPLELRPTNDITTLNSAAVQVGRVLKDGYSIAQQEKVRVTVYFYAHDNADAQKRNSYEVLRGAANDPVRPPIGVKFNKVNVSGVDHYYCKLLEGAAQPRISAGVTVYFTPAGATTTCTDASGLNGASYSVTLTFSGVGSRTVTVNQEGRVDI